MSAIRDARHITTAEDTAARRIAHGLLAVIAVLTAYSCVSDIPARRVVSDTVTLPRAELERRLQDARIDAARQAFAAKECRAFDEFKYPPRRRAPM